MSILAFIAVSVVAGTWVGIRWAEAGQRLDSIVATVLSTPLPDQSGCAACGAPDTGARAGDTPVPGAGSPLKPPAAAIQSASAAVSAAAVGTK